MSEGDGEGHQRAVLLDYLAHGQSDDSRPQYQKSPVGYAVSLEDFTLYEIAFDQDARVTIGTEVVVAPIDASDIVVAAQETDYGSLSSGATSELEYVIDDVVSDQEDRFVDFFNDAQPITLRLHQLNLLGGIGKKLRNRILDERKRAPFDSFEELEERVSGLHDPETIIVDRILEEIRDDDLKYRIFVGRQQSESD